MVGRDGAGYVQIARLPSYATRRLDMVDRGNYRDSLAGRHRQADVGDDAAEAEQGEARLVVVEQAYPGE